MAISVHRHKRFTKIFRYECQVTYPKEFEDGQRNGFNEAIPVVALSYHRLDRTHLWYSYLIAYMIEAIVIFALHKGRHIQFQLKG